MIRDTFPICLYAMLSDIYVVKDRFLCRKVTYILPTTILKLIRIRMEFRQVFSGGVSHYFNI